MNIGPSHLRAFLIAALLTPAYGRAQYGTSPRPDNDAQPATTIDSRLERMSGLLNATQVQLEQAQQQLSRLRSELEEMRSRDAIPAEASSSVRKESTTGKAFSPSEGLQSEVTHQQERQEILEAEVKQHDQIKVETISKYPVRIYGLLLFNAFSNAGVVDNPDLPSLPIPRTTGQSHGSVGASFRQTLLGLDAHGPKFLGARTSADLSFDLFGTLDYSYYRSTNGSVRLRRGDVRLAWGTAADPTFSRNEIHVGIETPLISPLSPTSFATVAQPALAWSGNLWTWAPQLQFKHTFSISAEHPMRSVQLEGGLFDPPVVGVSGAAGSRLVSAGEVSRRAGVLGRLSIHGGTPDNPFAFGVGGYSDRQTFCKGQMIRMWAITSDWQIPISSHFRLDGELYRGRGLGGLGGGAYKDVISGYDMINGQSRILGLNAVGGWAQLKTRVSQSIEGNIIYGQDGGIGADFRQLKPATSSYALESNARNQTAVANLIYRPRTYVILSPEYRRVVSWDTIGKAAVANIYTLSLGYQF